MIIELGGVRVTADDNGLIRIDSGPVTMRGTTWLTKEQVKILKWALQYLPEI